MKEEKAIFLSELPVNPCPFANRIIELKKEGKSNRDPAIRSCVMALIYMAYGQRPTMNLYDEYVKLNEQLIQKESD